MTDREEPADDHYGGTVRPRALLRRWSMPDLLNEPTDFDWLISGLLADPTYGQVAGEMKTLKSYVASFIAVGLASGVPIFGQFIPRENLPVVAYVGEGGRQPWVRRIKRICAAMGVGLGDLELHPIFDVAPISSPVFQESLRRDLDEIQPGLITLDPYYAYHGTATRASDLHQEGSLLNQLSTPCIDAGASLLMNNHMNQTGSGIELKRITGAGSGEWADSWLLLAHRKGKRDVEAGSFRLSLEIGSRQWGGTSWELDLDIGRFDVDTGQHDGAIAWDLRRAGASSSTMDQVTARADRLQSRICDLLAEHPVEMTREDIKRKIGGSRQPFDDAWASLSKEGVFSSMKGKHAEGGRLATRTLWGLAPTMAEPDRPGSVEDAA